MAIEFPKETRDRLIASIKRYVDEAFEQDIGDLKAGLLLDFVLKEIGPTIYNRAVSDAQARMSEMVDELDGTCYEPEPGTWTSRGTG